MIFPGYINQHGVALCRLVHAQFPKHLPGPVQGFHVPAMLFHENPDLPGAAGLRLPDGFHHPGLVYFPHGPRILFAEYTHNSSWFSWDQNSTVGALSAPASASNISRGWKPSMEANKLLGKILTCALYC